MPLLTDAVERLRESLLGTGFEDQSVTLARAPDAARCQYNRGVCIQATFGGKTGHVMTDAPVEGTTKVAFLFGAALAAPRQRTAAVAVLNAVSGFLLLARRLSACREECYAPCLSRLRAELAGSTLYAVGRVQVLERELAAQLVSDPAAADLLLVGADGPLSDAGLRVLEEHRGEKRILFLGPSTAGLSALLSEEHWCPYGR